MFFSDQYFLLPLNFTSTLLYLLKFSINQSLCTVRLSQNWRCKLCLPLTLNKDCCYQLNISSVLLPYMILLSTWSDNSSMSLKCNLDPLSHPLALVERFSSFLKDTPNTLFQTIRKGLVQELIGLDQIKGNLLAIDSCPIIAKVKENNLKTSVKNRFNKTKTPKGDPDCRLGVIIHFPKPFEKEVRFFWGYRNHVISDALSELPLTETTRPVNVQESKLFIPLFIQIWEEFNIPIEDIFAGSIYDAEYILDFIINDLEVS